MELDEALSHIWDVGAQIDKSLTQWQRHGDALARRQVKPGLFSKAKLFTSLIHEEPVIFSNLCIPIEGSTTNRAELLLEGVQNKIPRTLRVKVRSGPAQTPEYLTPRELVARWNRGKALFCITDFHFRETRLERCIDLQPLSKFNLLAHGVDSVAEQEMMTLVMSSRGAFTDSHSDDPDVSNHCVAGRKLWLVWDTEEGRQAGLEDVERDTVFDRAAFDLSTYCRLKSSRWLIVGPGQTLFLPGRFTHRVLTVERYLGFGSFSVSIPNLLQTVTRWTGLPPLWTVHKCNECLLDTIVRSAVDRLEALLVGTNGEKKDWGLKYLPFGVCRWLSMTSISDRHELQSHAGIREFVRLAMKVEA